MSKVKCKNKNCGKEFTARQADLNRGWGLYCYKSCKARVQESKTGQYSAYLKEINNNDEVNCEDYAYNGQGWG